MTIEDLIKIYETKKAKYGAKAYRHISNVLKEAKEQHKKDFTGNDHEQSWRAFKGKNLEKLIEYIITDEVRDLSLEVINGSILEGKVVNISLPIQIHLKVQKAPPGIKGDRAQGGTKTAILETGTELQVPLFIQEGDIIEINTEKEEYARRIEKQ